MKINQHLPSDLNPTRVEVKRPSLGDMVAQYTQADRLAAVGREKAAGRKMRALRGKAKQPDSETVREAIDSAIEVLEEADHPKARKAISVLKEALGAQDDVEAMVEAAQEAAGIIEDGYNATDDADLDSEKNDMWGCFLDARNLLYAVDIFPKSHRPVTKSGEAGNYTDTIDEYVAGLKPLVDTFLEVMYRNGNDPIDEEIASQYGFEDQYLDLPFSDAGTGSEVVQNLYGAADLATSMAGQATDDDLKAAILAIADYNEKWGSKMDSYPFPDDDSIAGASHKPKTKSGTGIESVDELIDAIMSAATDENGLADIADSIQAGSDASPFEFAAALSLAIDALTEAGESALAQQAQAAYDETDAMATASHRPVTKSNPSFDEPISIAEEWASEDEDLSDTLQDFIDALEADDVEAAQTIFSESLKDSGSPYASRLEDALAATSEVTVGDDSDSDYA